MFFHEEMAHTASMVNPSIGIRMTMHWSETLPILVQWRTMASGDYALGLEPSNTYIMYIMGRSAERKNGTLPVLKPFESVACDVAFTSAALE